MALVLVLASSPCAADKEEPKYPKAHSGFVASLEDLNRPFDVDDLFRIEYTQDARISPDGSQVVFIRETADLMDDRWHGHLWSVATEDGAQRPLTEGHHYDSSPRISPDGERVAFISDRDDSLQIYVKPLAAGPEQAARQLSRLGPGQDPWGLAWSPDGTLLSFVAHESTEAPRLGDLSPPPPGATWARPPRIIDSLIYRQDGRGYIEPGCSRLYLLPAGELSATGDPASTGTEARRATRADACLDEATVDVLNHHRDGDGAVWTPDGRHLIVAANHRTPREQQDHPIDLDLFDVDIATGDFKPLVTRSGLDCLPTVSPDGTKIAFIGFDDRGMAHQSAELYVANRDGTGVRSLTATLEHDLDSPRWTADGAAVLVTYHEGGVTHIARIALDGTRSVVAQGVSDGYGAYNGGGFTVSRNDRLAFTHSSSDEPGEIAVTQFHPGALQPALRRLTRFNAELTESRRVAGIEEVLFDTTDNQKIQGWLVRPPVPTEGPPPLILDIHGGPFLNYGARFDLEKQILAAHGFAVLYINPRGSIGYGETFANLIQHNYPGNDLRDLLAAVDLMVARGEASRR